MLIDKPVRLPLWKFLVTSPQGDPHPLGKRQKLFACCISGIVSEIDVFQTERSTLSRGLGEDLQTNNMTLLETTGSVGVLNGKLIPLVRLTVKYLSSLEMQGKSYSVINTHKSMIILSLVTMGNDSLVGNVLLSKYMIDLFTSKPPTPRYSSTYNVNIFI